MANKQPHTYRNTVEVTKTPSGHILVVIKTGEIVQAQANLEQAQAEVLLSRLILALETT